MPMWSSTERRCHVGHTTVANVADSRTVVHFAVGAASIAAAPAAVVGRRRVPNGDSNVSSV